MSTITIIVVVALVFLAALCVIALMIWKRETEMRTDSLKSIEQNLDRVLRELSDRNQMQRRRNRPDQIEEIGGGNIRQTDDEDPFAWVKKQEAEGKKSGTDDGKEKPKEDVPAEPSESEPADAGGSDDGETDAPDIPEKEEISKQLALEESFREIESLINELADDITEYEIDLDLIAAEEMESEETNADEGSYEDADQYLDIRSAEIEEQPVRAHMGYDIGRSGRKYTAEELEMLIKE